MPPVTERVKINGIKLSSELVLLRPPHGKHPPPSVFSHLLKRLSENRINLPYITTTDISGRHGMSCCVSCRDILQVTTLLTPDESICKHIQYIDHVGAVSIFPHQSRMKILGTLLYVLGTHDLTVYGLASSISSLFFITDYADFEKAVACLKRSFNLPDHYVPMRES